MREGHIKLRRIFYNGSGFTLIEIIGVLAVLAILVALVAPKIFKTVAESKTTRLAVEVNTYSIAVARWYKDMGTLASLKNNGTIDTTDNNFHNKLISSGGKTAGLWSKWQGPYIDSVGNILIGTGLAIRTRPGTAGTGVPGNNDGTSFDLNDDNANDMDGLQVVFMRITGATSSDFNSLDSAIDRGLNSAQNATSGKVKFNGASTIHIWLSSG